MASVTNSATLIQNPTQQCQKIIANLIVWIFSRLESPFTDHKGANKFLKAHDMKILRTILDPTPDDLLNIHGLHPDTTGMGQNRFGFPEHSSISVKFHRHFGPLARTIDSGVRRRTTAFVKDFVTNLDLKTNGPLHQPSHCQEWLGRSDENESFDLCTDMYRIQAVLDWEKGYPNAYKEAGFLHFMHMASDQGLLPVWLHNDTKLQRCFMRGKSSTKRDTLLAITDWVDWQEIHRRRNNPYIPLQMSVFSGMVMERDDLQAQSAPDLVKIMNAATLSLKSDQHQVVNFGLPRGFFEWLKSRQGNAGVGRARTNV